MRSALVHDWLVSAVGGGEKCLEAIARLFPSPIYTLVQNQNKLAGTYFEALQITSSFLQKMPKAETKYRSYLPLFPLAIQQFNLSSFDLVISSSHCVAKGVATHSKQLHICYCYTPVRYAWDLREDYLKDTGLDRGLKGWLARSILRYLRKWDVRSSKGVDHFIAISHYVADRIKRCYGRQAYVIYPPVDLSYYQLEEKKENYYVAASRFVPYKKMKLIVEAFSQMPERKLVVIGDGPEWKSVSAAAGRNVELLGYQSDAVLRGHLQKAKAFVFAAVEDFGILPIEAMGCGTPVIAFGQGAIRETVEDGKTGLFFHEQTATSLIDAVSKFEGLKFDPKQCRERAEMFSQERFNTEFNRFVMDKYSQFSLGR